MFSNQQEQEDYLTEEKDLVEVEKEEQLYSDEMNLFDYIALSIGTLCAILNVLSYFEAIDIWFTSLS